MTNYFIYSLCGSVIIFLLLMWKAACSDSKNVKARKNMYLEHVLRHKNEKETLKQVLNEKKNKS